MKARQAISDMRGREVVVDRLRLIETLKDNRNNHVANYRSALVAYKRVAKKRLDEQVAELRKQIKKLRDHALVEINNFNIDHPTELSGILICRTTTVDIITPVSYEEHYDAAIAMAEWETSDTIKLTASEFNCFVRDIWEWSEAFESHTMEYTRG